MLAPYISITDFTCREQVDQMLKLFREQGGSVLGRKLGVGVMMSYKTLNNVPSKSLKNVTLKTQDKRGETDGQERIL